jgi:hypothetical protein
MNSYECYRDSGKPVDQLLEAWAEHWDAYKSTGTMPDEHSWALAEMLWLSENDPEKSWVSIVGAMKNPRCIPHLGDIAAGPLEDLLSHHGPAIIDRVEQEADHDPLFADLLKGTWQSLMSTEIWERVQAARDRKHDGSQPVRE